MPIRFLLLLVFFLCDITALKAAPDTLVVRNLSHDWYFYHERDDEFLPLISKDDFKGTTLHFELSPDDLAGNQLRISSKDELSLFLNNEIIAVFKGVRLFDLESLQQGATEENLLFTLYNEHLSPYEVSVQIIATETLAEGPLSGHPPVIYNKQSKPFKNFITVVCLIIAGILAGLYNYFPRMTADFLRITRTFALRETEENLFKTRPFSRVNLLFYFFLSLLASGVIIFLINRSGLYPDAGIFYPDHLWDGVWRWIEVSFLICVWLFFKYFLISNMSALFALKGFVASHFYNYIRMSLLVFLLALIIILFSYYGFEITSPQYYMRLFKFVYVFMGIGAMVLFFKLMSLSPYKTLHLFSYLCATEVIPFVILLVFGLNQPF